MSDNEQIVKLAIFFYLKDKMEEIAKRDVKPWSPSHEQPKRVSTELEEVLKFADRDPEKARRAAELLEALNRPDEALDYWHRAAALGDPDAVDMVEVLYFDIQ